ncbi:rho GTPase-activating protein 24-like [Notechis scutatus]|uniref:Rho GTPase-activating protein 24-like n=1 Tax=Notechis scutatus TaxID=8663 RepID=A0A6J1VMF0_9SAUR|nr:rho GTPase-activating protein 24-like [Notechis scutatus]
MNNCSKCSISHKDVSTCQSFLRCHLAHLKKQMAQQRAEYEAIVLSLEQQNKERDIEVKDLHSKLDQQRQWHRLVETKICNAERARKDAERKNETLQREMEEFFCTFGKLTSEEKLPEQIHQSF